MITLLLKLWLFVVMMMLPPPELLLLTPPLKARLFTVTMNSGPR